MIDENVQRVTPMKSLLELLINNIGKSYHDLVKLGLVEKNSLRESQYEDSHSLEIESIPGLELVFDPIAHRLESIYIRLRNYTGLNLTIYSDPLPKPFDQFQQRNDSYKYVGMPLSSTEADNSQGFPTSDHFQLNTDLHPAALMDLQYGEDEKLNVIAISLFDASA